MHLYKKSCGVFAVSGGDIAQPESSSFFRLQQNTFNRISSWGVFLLRVRHNNTVQGFVEFF